MSAYFSDAEIIESNYSKCCVLYLKIEIMFAEHNFVFLTFQKDGKGISIL